MIKTSIITVLYNRADLTQKFLSEIIPYLNETNELILVDNNSTDNTKFVVNLFKSQTDKNIKLIENSENYGFGKGNNIGAKNARGHNLIFISNDVTIDGNFIKIYEDNIEFDKIYGARLLDFDTGWNVYRRNGEVLQPIIYIEGWCFGVNSITYKRIDGFDENIFIDAEDLELSYRASFLGCELVKLDLPVRHLHPGSSFQNINRLELTNKSIKYFCEKYNLEKV